MVASSVHHLLAYNGAVLGVSGMFGSSIKYVMGLRTLSFSSCGYCLFLTASTSLNSAVRNPDPEARDGAAE